MTSDKHQRTIDAMKDSIERMFVFLPIESLDENIAIAAWGRGEGWPECPTEGAGERGRG